MDTPQLLHYFALLIGIVACLVGLGAMTMPKLMFKGFGLNSEGHSLFYLVSIGARDVFVGGVVIYLFTQKLWGGIVVTSLLISFIAAIDCLVVWTSGNKKTAFVHAAGALIATSYSVLLYTIAL